MFYKFRALVSFLIIIAAPNLSAQWVKVAQDPDKGWRLMVDGKPMAVHGVVWSFTPIGDNYSYNLWDQPKELIQQMIDTDAVLMKQMGVNSIRVFTDVPPEWITYLYNRYGIYTVVNDLFGRYGIMLDGRWYAKTNYADLRAREAILKALRKNISRYVNVPGVLFYLLGNENNYGLEWDSNAIENLPVGQRLEVRAGYLYSLFEEGINIVKEIDPTKPVGIVNGDIQYMNIIKALTPSLDLLGVNTYRGDSAQELFYEGVASSLNVPIVFTEFGADAYNVVEEREDQYNQALYIKNQWEEIYRQSYGKGRIGNILGGFVFEWMDEWWKSAGMVLELDVHNTDASWSNGSYAYDAAYGENNMNEEWWGIVAQSPVKTSGIHQRRPRAVYYALQKVWTLDQYECTDEEISARFDIDLRPLANQARLNALEQKNKEQGNIDFRGKIDVVGVTSFDNIDVDGDNGFDNAESSVGEWAYLGFDLNAFENVDAGITFRLQGHVPETTFELEEYSRYETKELAQGAFFDTDTTAFNSADSGETHSSLPYAEIYDAYVNWQTKYTDIDFYYHNGHTDWGIEGDYFHLLPESFDYIGMDINKSKAPFGIEFTGKEFLDGTKIYGGPEIYWGAKPQLMAKYYKSWDKFSFALIYNEVFSRTQTDGGVEPIGHGRRASAWANLNFLPWISADFGVLFSGMEYLGDSYTHVERSAGGTYTTELLTFDALDTLSFKTDLKSEIFLYTKLFARYTYAGRLVTSSTYFNRNGTQMAEIGEGNRHEITGGLQFQFGPISIMPQFLVRIPLSHPTSLADGASRRFALREPMAVFRNREAYQGELVVAFDPTGDTYFFDWNNSDRENAKFAGYVSFLYSFYEGATDVWYYKNEFGDYVTFNSGLPAVNGLWSLKSRLLWNAAPKLRFIAGVQGGLQQSWGENTRKVSFWGGSLMARLDKWVFSSSVDVNNWGHADWMRELNITFPLQWTLDISRGFDIPSLLNSSNRIGVRWKGRTFDEYSEEDDYGKGVNWRMEMLFYLSMSW